MNSDVIIVIPARGGSKRVPRKNIRTLAGRPLMAYTIATALNAGFDGLIYVSTEDAEIAEVARREGAQVIDRPLALAADASSTEDTLIHALDAVAPTGFSPNWVMTLPPTSPFRSDDTLRFFMAAAKEGDVDALLSLTESKGDYWRCDESGAFARLFPTAPRRQQDRQPLYEENSAVYVTSAQALRETRSVLGRRRRGIVIDRLEGYDINDAYDFAVAEALITAGVTRSTSPYFVQCA